MSMLQFLWKLRDEKVLLFDAVAHQHNLRNLKQRQDHFLISFKLAFAGLSKLDNAWFINNLVEPAKTNKEFGF